MSVESRVKTDGGRGEQLTELLEELRESGELDHKRGQELLQLSVMEISDLVVATSDLDWDDVSTTLRLLSDAAAKRGRDAEE